MTLWYCLTRTGGVPLSASRQTWMAVLLDAENDLRFGPVLFQAVVVAFRGREDVDDHRPEVDQHPVRRRCALASQGPGLLVAQAADDAAGDRVELPLRSARADHEVVGHRRLPR